MSHRIRTRLEKGTPKVRVRSLLKSTALGPCGALLISACTSSNKIVPSYDAGLNDSDFDPRRTDSSSSTESSGSDTTDSVTDDSATTEEDNATDPFDAGAERDAGADAGMSG